MNLKKLFRRALKKFIPPTKTSTKEWANKHRWLDKKQANKSGKYNTGYTPWIPGIMDALDDPDISEVHFLKPSQAAWTDGALGNYIGRRIEQDPCQMMVLFPKEQSIKKWLRQKFNPMVTATPVLRDLIDITSRSASNTQEYKEFPGGSMYLFGSNVPDNIKGVSIEFGAVEEPDDCSGDVQGQGDSVDLLKGRLKTFDNSKLAQGGTPTIKGFSRIERDYENSDQQQFYVPCHQCGEEQTLKWDQLIYESNAKEYDPILGKAQPETARYLCEHCGSTWSNQQKNINVKKGRWIAGRLKKGIAGFRINELYFPYKNSSFKNLITNRLKAEEALTRGDESLIIGFTNNSMGESYAYKDDAPAKELLEERAEDYTELIIPLGGFVLTIGVDVQPSRLAIIILATGRHEESWIVYWGEIHALSGVNDINDPCWFELDRVIFGMYRHESGGLLRVTAVNIDSGDGNTNDAVYSYVRSRKNKGAKIRAIKGDSKIDAPLTRLPKKLDIDTSKHKTKAAKYGLEIWMIGVSQGKDSIAARIKLTGNGPHRLHWYNSIRHDFYDQILGESKIPSRKHNGKKTWQKKSGSQVEALDCLNYSLAAARMENLHTKKGTYWDHLEHRLLQSDLLGSCINDDEIISYINEKPDPEDDTADNNSSKDDSNHMDSTPIMKKPLINTGSVTVKPGNKKNVLAEMGRRAGGR